MLGANAGYPYGIGLGVGKGDMTGVVGDESQIDNKQQFIPLTKPVQVSAHLGFEKVMHVIFFSKVKLISVFLSLPES